MLYPPRAYYVIPNFPDYYIDRALVIWQLSFFPDYKNLVKIIEKKRVKPVQSGVYFFSNKNGDKAFYTKSDIIKIAKKIERNKC